MGWLDGDNKNFIDAHIYACGKSEVPEIFHRWACISLIAAAVADRVFVKKMGEPLYPNMYTFLIGPSGLGKGEAISAVGRLARQVEALNWLRVKRTAQGLLDKLAARQKDRATGDWIYPNSKLFLVMPELGMAIGSGRIADEFIKHMTDLYTVSDDSLDEGTRTSGSHHIPAPCVKGNVEALTPSGWVKLCDLQEDTPIMQWHPSDEFSFCIPESVIRQPRASRRLIHWKGELHDCGYTEEHRLPVISGRDEDQIKARTAQELATVSEFKIPISGQWNGGTQADSTVKLLAAIQADGTIDCQRVHFTLKKQRKIERLFELCDELNVAVDCRGTNEAGSSLYVIWGQPVEQIIERIGESKLFGSWLLNYDRQTLEDFIEEVQWWDGGESRQHSNTRVYFSKVEQNAEWVATVAHLTRRAAYKVKRPTEFCVTIRSQNKTGLSKQACSSEEFDGEVFCVTVPSSYFLIRSEGKICITGNCLNWLVGTTKEWLISSITKDALYGGFIARTNCVQADYDLSKRYDEPWFPADKDEVRAYLVGRLRKLTRRAGEVKISPKAKEAIRFWYQNREAPDPEDPMTPSWKREHDLILKLCTVLALADDVLIIQPEHFNAAEKLARQLTQRMPDLITYASTTIYTEAIQRAAAIVRRAKSIRQDVLLRRLGISAEQFNDVKATLTMMKLVVVDAKNSVFNPVFRWVEKGPAHIIVEDDTSHASHEDRSSQSGTVSG